MRSTQFILCYHFKFIVFNFLTDGSKHDRTFSSTTGQGLYRVINLPTFQSIFPLPIWAHDEQDIHWWWPQTFFHMLMSQSSPNNTIIINSIQSQQHSGKMEGFHQDIWKAISSEKPLSTVVGASYLAPIVEPIWLEGFCKRRMAAKSTIFIFSVSFKLPRGPQMPAGSSECVFIRSQHHSVWSKQQSSVFTS